MALILFLLHLFYVHNINVTEMVKTLRHVDLRASVGDFSSYLIVFCYH